MRDNLSLSLVSERALLPLRRCSPRVKVMPLPMILSRLFCSNQLSEAAEQRQSVDLGEMCQNVRM